LIIMNNIPVLWF